MLSGIPHQARWVRPEPQSSWPERDIEQMARTAFPGTRLAAIKPLAGGLRNTNVKLLVEGTREPVVLRIYQHDPSLCQKELDLIRLVSRTVPVPEVLHAEPRGLDDLPPFVLMRFVDGISFRDLRRSGDGEATAQAAFSVGQAVAAIGRTSFNRSGWLGPGPEVTTPLLEGPNAIERFVDLCLAAESLQQRMPPELRRALHELVWQRAPDLPEETRLVHGDFNRRNLLVRPVSGRWTVVAVLDWEFAIAGSPLQDAANFLRYGQASSPLTEQQFSAGYLAAGGQLPPDWRNLARLMDLTAICESLTHETLGDDVVTELVELVRATVVRLNPQLE